MAIPKIQEGIEARAYQRPKKLNIFICDVSGSMYGSMRALKEDTVRRIHNIPQGDALLINIFSSQGWNRWVIARELQTKNDYDKCEAIVKEEFYARNMTCFSEALSDTPAQVVPFIDRYPVVSLIFSSDGHPVVRDLRVEEEAIHKAALAIAPLLSSGAVVAFSDYANRTILSKLAAILGIELVTAENVEQIGEAFEKVSKGRAARRKKVKLPARSAIAFAMDPDGSVSPLDRSQDEVLVDEFSDVYAGTTTNIESHKDNPIFVQYAAALTLLTEGRTEEALLFLSTIGDIALVQALANALTNAEIARVEQKIREAVMDPNMRFTGGCVPNCLPAEDAFDLLDLLGQFMSEPEAKFFPRHKDFVYKRIGRATEQKPNYPEFKADDGVAVGFSKLVGNSKELNLSVLVKIPGTIQLPDTITLEDGITYIEREAIKLDKTFNTFVWRNYALISNALPQTTKLPVSLPLTLQQALAAHPGVLPNIKTTNGKGKSLPASQDVVTLDLTQLPICNRKRGKEATDWKRMADMGLESLRLGSIIKVLKDKREELDPGREGERAVTYTEEQFQFLTACGVKRDGDFSPPVTQAEPTDVLNVRVLEVKVDKGSPVSMKDFKAAMANGKKLNFVGELMKVGQDLIDAAMPTQSAKAIVWLQDVIKTHEQLKQGVDQELNARRFAVALTGGWARSHKTDKVTIMAGLQADHPVHLEFREIEKKI